jgi:hypothetical protein
MQIALLIAQIHSSKIQLRIHVMPVGLIAQLVKVLPNVHIAVLITIYKLIIPAYLSALLDITAIHLIEHVKHVALIVMHVKMLMFVQHVKQPTSYI